MDFFNAHAYPWLLLIGCALCPRLVIAVLALAYWQTNPVLVVIAWIYAFTSTGESAHSSVKRVRARVRSG